MTSVRPVLRRRRRAQPPVAHAPSREHILGYVERRKADAPSCLLAGSERTPAGYPHDHWIGPTLFVARIRPDTTTSDARDPPPASGHLRGAPAGQGPAGARQTLPQRRLATHVVGHRLAPVRARARAPTGGHHCPAPSSVAVPLVHRLQGLHLSPTTTSTAKHAGPLLNRNDYRHPALIR